MSIESPAERPQETDVLRDLANRRLLQIGLAVAMLMAGGKAAEAEDADGGKVKIIERQEKKVDTLEVKYAQVDAGMKKISKDKEVHYFGTRLELRDDKGTKGAGDDWLETCSVIRADSAGESVFALDCQEHGFRANPLLPEGVGQEGVGVEMGEMDAFQARSAIDHVAGSWSAYEAMLTVGKGDSPEAAYLLSDAKSGAAAFMKENPKIALNKTVLKKLGIGEPAK